jgi:hypothetical protein
MVGKLKDKKLEQAGVSIEDGMVCAKNYLK